MKTKSWALFFSIIISIAAFSQDEESKEAEEEKKGFKKEKLFTGGSISLSFFNNTFLVGGSPVFGYSLTRWLDAGIVVNYNYTSMRDYRYFDDKLRQTVYGGGAFTRIYPLKFIFAQAQVEHNWIKLKYIPPDNSSLPQEKYNEEGNSVLVGGGYTNGRDPQGGSAFFYLAVLFDIGKDDNSPYVDNAGRTIPIIRAGYHIPLFQGSRNR